MREPYWSAVLQIRTNSLQAHGHAIDPSTRGDRRRWKVGHSHQSRPLQAIEVRHGLAVHSNSPRVLSDMTWAGAGLIVRKRYRRHDRAQNDIITFEEPCPGATELLLLLLQRQKFVVRQAHGLGDAGGITARSCIQLPRDTLRLGEDLLRHSV